jgi:hypothetical protein
VDPAGKVHVVAHDRTWDQLRYATNASGSWVAATMDPSPCGARPRLVSDHNGILHAAYLSSTVGLGWEFVRCALKVPGQSWTLVGGAVPSDPRSRHSLAVRSSSQHLNLAAVDTEGVLQTYSGFRSGGLLGRPFTITWTPSAFVPPPASPPQFGDTDVVVVGAQELHLVVHERTTGSLYYAVSDATPWEVEEIDSEPERDVGAFCSLAIDRQTGRLHVAYYDATSKDLRYARKDPGGPWVRRIIEAVGDVGSHAAIQVDGSGKVYIAYRDETRRSLRVAIGTP